MSAINDKFGIVPIEAYYDRELTPAEFRMLAVLYSFRDKNANTVWPRLETLMERVGYSDTTQVSRMTTKLEKKGWLTKSKKRGPRGPKIYELVVPSRIQLGSNSQLDSTRQVDIPEQEEPVPDSQVDSLGQVDIPEHETEANLTHTVKSQVDPHGHVAYEQTSINKPITQQTSESSGADSATVVAKPVDNSMPALGVDYQSPNAGELIFGRGVKFLTGYPGVDEVRARACLGRWKRDYGEGRTLDAVIVAILSYPQGDPIAFIQGVLNRQPRPIDTAWEPEAAQVAELEAQGIPNVLIREARDVFVVWFASMEIMHSDWPRLFRDWVHRDWENAERQVFAYRQRLAKSAGMRFEKPFQEPA